MRSHDGNRVMLIFLTLAALAIGWICFFYSEYSYFDLFLILLLTVGGIWIMLELIVRIGMESRDIE